MTNTNQNNHIQKFHSDEFGSLEVTMINGKPYFPASECAKLLGYSKPRIQDSRWLFCKKMLNKEASCLPPKPQG